MRWLLAVFCLSALAPAQVRNYQLNSGDIVRAEILGVDREAGRVEYRFLVGGGSGTTSRPLSDFTPHSRFNILRTEVEANDIEGHVQLAEFAVNHGLIAAGKRELFKARDLANDFGIEPELEARLMEEAMVVLEQLLRGMLEEGNLRDAHYVLTEIMAGERISDEDKDRFARLVERRETEIENARARARAERRAGALDAEHQRQLRPLQERLQRGEDAQQVALRNLGNQGRALSEYGVAIRDFDWVIGQVERLSARHANDPGFVAELAALGQQAETEKISALLGQASIYTTRGSFNQALGAVGEVLAIDSGNRQALNARARIEIAANSDWGIGPRTLGRPGGRIR